MRELRILLLTLVLLPLPATAQEDEGRIVRFLESQLSDGSARQVDIQGFRGALSSAAELNRLVISDADGPWLVMEDARLVWSRAALLSGALSVQELSAARLEIIRPPPPREAGLDLPEAEATPFALPDLPVSIQIDRVAIEEVILGGAVLGFAARLSVEGDVQLADGEGAANLQLQRFDGPRGVFDLGVRYANASETLDLSLLLEEDAGGLAAELLNLPGRPPIRLDLAGSGPIDEFTAAISLASDGQPRLTGEVSTEADADTGARVILVDIGGDISPLVAPQYRAFFGTDVALTARVTQAGDGALSVETLSLRSAALHLNGDLSLAPDGTPLAFSLTGRVSGPDGGAIRLPVPGTEVNIGSADLNVRYDQAAGDQYGAEFLLSAFDAQDLQIDRVRLDAGGLIAQEASGLAVSSALDLTVSGLSHADPGLAEAIGPGANLTGQISWLEGAPVFLTDLVAQAGNLGLMGTAALELGENRLELTLDVSTETDDLTRFSTISGLPIEGALTAGLVGSVELLSGAFDVSLTGATRDLVLIDGLPPELLAGETTMSISARRDETGLTLDALSLEGVQLLLSGSGRLSGTAGQLEAETRLADIGLFTDAVRGPVSATVSLTRDGDAPWQTTADMTGPNGIGARLTGTVGLPDGSVNLQATGSLPLSLANRSIQPRSVTGQLGFDLVVSGQPTLEAVSGSFSANGARVSLPVLQTSLQNTAISGRISGGRVSFTANGTLGSGGSIAVDGSVGVASPSLPANITVTGRSLRLIDPTLYNALIDRVDLSINGALTGGLQVSGAVDLGETEVRVPETGLGATSIPPIRHIGETGAERQTRSAAGLLPRAGTGGGSQRMGLDLTLSAPGRVFIRGRGLDAELGGNLRIGGTSANVIPSGRFDLIRGRLSILGTRLDLNEGSASLQGSFDPFIRLLASSRSGGYTINIGLIGPVASPDISITSDPALPEDEVLAQLLFGRSVAALSPIQLLRMADAAASLAGGSSETGIFANLREGLGLDDLDLQTDATGGAAVRAGRYLSENVYADVTVGSTETDLSLNIDLTPSITARGSFSSDGSSSVGIFYERDY